MATLQPQTKTAEEETPREQATTKERREIQLPDVIAAVAAYSPPGGRVAIKAALSAHEPVLEGEKIRIVVNNELILSRLQELQPQFRDYLRGKLYNDYIELELALYVPAEGEEQETHLFTAEDKFKHFVEQNPAVGKLQAVFGLEFD